MIFITGPRFGGKRELACGLLHCTRDELARRAVWDAQDLAAGADGPAALERLADELAAREVVIADEVGGGIVPADADARRARENAGRLACLLAARADCVVRVLCGLPLVLKGSLQQ